MYVFYNILMNVVRVILSISLAILIVYSFILIHLMATENFSDTKITRSALKKEAYSEIDKPIIIRCNLLLTGLKVTHSYGRITIKVPIKFFWQITPNIDLTRELKSRIDSAEFKSFLKTYYEDYRFSEPLRERNAYVIHGEYI